MQFSNLSLANVGWILLLRLLRETHVSYIYFHIRKQIIHVHKLWWAVDELKRGKLSCAIREIRKERNVTIYKQGKKSLNVIIKCIILHDITSIRAYVFSYRERERVRRLQSEKKIIIHTIYQPVYIMRLVRMCVPIFLNLCKSLCFFGRCWKNNPHLLPHKRISLCETFFLWL